MCAPFKGDLTPEMETFNTTMAKMRVCVEWSIGKIAQTFAFVDYHKNMNNQLENSFISLPCLLIAIHAYIVHRHHNTSIANPQ